MVREVGIVMPDGFMAAATVWAAGGSSWLVRITGLGVLAVFSVAQELTDRKRQAINSMALPFTTFLQNAIKDKSFKCFLSSGFRH